MNDYNVEYNREGLLGLPLLALRGLAIFPNMLMHFDVGREKSVKALEEAMRGARRIFLVAQKEIKTDEPKADELYEMGTVCLIKQILRIPGENTVRVLVEGQTRARIVKIEREKPFFFVRVQVVEPPAEIENTPVIEALVRRCYNLFEQYSELAPKPSPEVLLNVVSSTDPGYIADYIAQNILIRHTEKQAILEELNPRRRLEKMNSILEREIEILNLEQGIANRVQEQLGKNQRDYILREQMKVIQSELGESDDALEEIEKYREKIYALKLPKESEEKLLREVARLSKQPFSSQEAAVLRNYIETCIELPWRKESRERISVETTEKVLNADHYGLTKVKERILETVAVRKLKPDVTGQILCLVGPPGVGKTSIAMSVARALGRKAARISLGGVRDESDIRGHRKTYVGAMPGRIMAAMLQVGVKNPVLVLDEIDKMGQSYMGDPAAALLEVLDSEQNHAFRDHFIELPFDLSRVLFITTANTTDTIPRPLLDRMEVIELTSYTDEEKLQIAKRHLVPKQIKKHGLSARQLRITDDALREIAAGYTRESGVRLLEREIARICRKTAKRFVTEEGLTHVTVKASDLNDILGPRKYLPEKIESELEVGVVNGLAWTATGGELLEVEAAIVPGTGKLELTGNLGDVMKESVHAATTYIRSRVDSLGIDPEFYKKNDIHLHFPEGAVPKDGPSAGIAITTALVSALTGAPVRRSLAMTGEITLRGRVLPIGGLKEKSMAALRNGIKTVIIPADNEKDLSELDPLVTGALKYITVSHVDSVISAAIDFTDFHPFVPPRVNVTVEPHVEPHIEPSAQNVPRIKQ
ncbi:MAG: endopeptidase La [Oscillospiraceae bacterium]|jgi:ATP-dependent Lon protease